MNQFRFFVVGVLPACQRLEHLDYEMTKAVIEQANAVNTGNLPAIPPPPEPAYDGGIFALEVIRGYIQMLESAYCYNVDPPPNEGG